MPSFPYTTTSPPPTSGALTVVDRANESLSYSGGGGGGSVGPNPVISTLTFPGGDQVTAGVIKMSSILTINDNATPVVQDFIFNTNFVSTGAADWNLISSFTSTPNVFQVNGQAGNAASGQLISFAGSDGNNGLLATDSASGLSKLYLVGSSVVVPNDLTVSSINGAAPGGGGSVGPNPSVSSLTLASGGQINLNASGSSLGTLNLEYNSTISQGSQIAFQVSSGPGGFLSQYYHAPTSSIKTEYVSEIGGPQGPGGYSMAFANISSLSVSSINLSLIHI